MRNEYTAIIEEGGDGWLWAHTPDVPGAHGQGRTEDEALDDLRAALALLIEHRRDKAREAMAPGARDATVAVG